MLFLGMYKSTADMGELGNRIGNDGCTYLADFIKSNKVIRILSIIHNNIDNTGLKDIADALEVNNNILYFEYGQYGLVVDKEIKEKFIHKLNQNCMSTYNIDYNTFIKTRLRDMKHTKKINCIDSIYRNNDK